MWTEERVGAVLVDQSAETAAAAGAAQGMEVPAAAAGRRWDSNLVGTAGTSP